MNFSIAALALLIASWRPLETTCGEGKPACFADLKKAAASCKVVRHQTAGTALGDVTVDWRRCPAPGFKTVKGADYVVVSGEDGDIWGFTNVIDPSAASIEDVGFFGSRWILVRAFSATGASRSWCMLGLSPSPPQCLVPDIPELEAKAQSLLKPAETLCCEDWSLEEVTSWRMIAARPIFREKNRVAMIRASLWVRRYELSLRRVRREEIKVNVRQ
ncbi:MAG: hypothetical protein E6J78_06015 [Deltaproteobacteria bacterium]|nr:MAG: hypothetical protein E6J78_06015 [Deltaproteobacteria bacterium]